MAGDDDRSSVEANVRAVSSSLGQLRREAAEEFLRLYALAGPKANTFLIQKQVDAEYATRLTTLEAELEIAFSSLRRL